MKKISVLSIVFLFFLGLARGYCQDVTNRQILEKLNSMDVRIARLEEGQKSFQKQIDNLREETRAGQQSIQNQINGLQNQINSLQNLVIGGFGVVFAGIFALIGFVLWDRRTALAPAVKKVEALEKKEEALERVLKDFAIKEPRLTEALQHAGIL